MSPNPIFSPADAPWSSKCQALFPPWEELGMRYQNHPTVTIARIDITANDIQLMYLDRYPFFQLFPTGSQQVRGAGSPVGYMSVTSAISPRPSSAFSQTGRLLGSGPGPAQSEECFPSSPRKVPRLTLGGPAEPAPHPRPEPWGQVDVGVCTGPARALGSPRCAASVGSGGRCCRRKEAQEQNSRCP